MTESHLETLPDNIHGRQSVPPLPFAATALGETEMRVVRRVLAEWAAETGFTKQTHVKVATEYARYCSAPGATQVGIELAAEYLAWFLCLNDLPPDDHKRSLLRGVRQVLKGSTAPSEPEIDATQIFLRRLEHRLGRTRLQRFLWRTHQMIDAFEWEVDRLQRAPRNTLSAEQYMSRRQHLIAHYPYIELWRLSEGIDVERAELWPVLERVEGANTRIIFWVNDMLSIARDARKAKINLVSCIANDNNWSEAKALEHARRILTQSLSEYLGLRNDLASLAGGDPGIDRHTLFLDSVLEGNRVATIVLQERFWGDE